MLPKKKEKTNLPKCILKYRQKPTAFVAPVDTKFIVTLDGVNPDEFDADKEQVGVDLETSEIPKKVVIPSAPEIKPITFSLKDTDG